MSSFGAIEIDMEELNIDFLCTSSNKNIQGMAGISLVIANNNSLEKIKNFEKRNLYLDLYSQYNFFRINRQLRFTPPVQCFYALNQAVEELVVEGIKNRYKRYSENWDQILKNLTRLGFKPEHEVQKASRIITVFRLPEKIKFEKLHDELYKESQFIQVSIIVTFRIANIGNIKKEDIIFIETLEKEKCDANYYPMV